MKTPTPRRAIAAYIDWKINHIRIKGYPGGEYMIKALEEILPQVVKWEWPHAGMIEIAGVNYTNAKLPVGTKVKFPNEKQRYTVQASNVRFAVCTKPFNAQKTVLYSIIDFWDDTRWPENLVFGMWAETREECEEMLQRLTDGETEVSSRHGIRLQIEALELPKEKKIRK